MITQIGSFTYNVTSS